MAQEACDRRAYPSDGCRNGPDDERTSGDKVAAAIRWQQHLAPSPWCIGLPRAEFWERMEEGWRHSINPPSLISAGQNKAPNDFHLLAAFFSRGQAISGSCKMGTLWTLTECLLWRCVIPLSDHWQKMNYNMEFHFEINHHKSLKKKQLRTI